MMSTKILSVLGAALSLAAAALATDLPTAVRILALLPAVTLSGVAGWRFLRRRKNLAARKPRPLDRVNEAEEPRRHRHQDR